MAYPNQHIHIEIPHGSRSHAIAPGTVKITFNIHNYSADEAYSIAINVVTALVKKKNLTLWSKETDTNNNSDIY